MNMLTGFSAHLCDVVQKPRRPQKPIVTILLSDRPIVPVFLVSILIMRSNHIFLIVRVWVSSGVITYL